MKHLEFCNTRPRQHVASDDSAPPCWRHFGWSSRAPPKKRQSGAAARGAAPVGLGLGTYFQSYKHIVKFIISFLFFVFYLCILNVCRLCVLCFYFFFVRFLFLLHYRCFPTGEAIFIVFSYCVSIISTSSGIIFVFNCGV